MIMIDRRFIEALTEPGLEKHFKRLFDALDAVIGQEEIVEITHTIVEKGWRGAALPKVHGETIIWDHKGLERLKGKAKDVQGIRKKQAEESERA